MELTEEQKAELAKNLGTAEALNKSEANTSEGKGFKGKWSLTTKILVGVGIAAAIGGAFLIYRRFKN